MGGFRRPIPMVQDGQPVKALVTNRSAEALASNIEYLFTRIQAMDEGAGVYIRDALADTTLLVGQPAFYNPVTHQFERALGDVTTDADSGELIPKPSSNVRGIVTSRVTAGTVDILTSGTANVDLSNAIVGDPVEGAIYYLSNGTAGRLVAQQPEVGVPVLQVGPQQSDGTWQVFVQLQITDYLNRHRHYSYELVCEPAGTTSEPAYDGRHEITDPDEDVEGWLPADADVFAGLAPAGAAFGYNLSASSLRHLWPPVPLSSVCIEMVREDGVAAGMGVTVPLGEDQMCLVDQNGIWWLSDCHGEAPWPTALDTENPDSESVSTSVIECPRHVPMSLKVFFVRHSFISGSTAVLSLRAAEGSGLTLRCAGQLNEADVGHLEIDFDLAPEDGADDEEGFLVFKSITGNQFNRGPVASAVRAGAANVTVTGTGPTVTIDDEEYATGAITVVVDQELEDTELSIETLQLESVLETKYQGVLGLNFPASRTSGLRGCIRVPSKDVLPDNAQLKLRLWLMGRTAGTVPDDSLEVSYRVISRPSTPTALPTSDTVLALDSGATLGSADLYYEVESDPIDISPGDIVLFSLTRSSDAYAGDLFLLRRAGVVVIPE